MYDRDLQHPDITHIERVGAPPGQEWSRACPSCDGGLERIAYEIDGVEVCEECFKEWLISSLDAAQQIADALHIKWRYII